MKKIGWVALIALSLGLAGCQEAAVKKTPLSESAKQSASVKRQTMQTVTVHGIAYRYAENTVFIGGDKVANIDSEAALLAMFKDGVHFSETPYITDAGALTMYQLRPQPHLSQKFAKVTVKAKVPNPAPAIAAMVMADLTVDDSIPDQQVLSVTED